MSKTYTVTIYLDTWDALKRAFKDVVIFEMIWSNISDDLYDEICEELAEGIGKDVSKFDIDFNEYDLEHYGIITEEDIGAFNINDSDGEFVAIDVNFTIDVDSYVEDHVI